MPDDRTRTAETGTNRVGRTPSGGTEVEERAGTTRPLVNSGPVDDRIVMDGSSTLNTPRDLPGNDG